MFMRIAVASGKGGTGKTMVSTNLFWVAQKQKLPISIVDCDAEEPNVGEFVTGDNFFSCSVNQKIPVIDTEKCTFCNKCHDYCNYHAIICLPPAKFIQVVEDLCHDCGACFVACEFGAITVKEKQLGTIKSEYISNYADFIEGRTEVGVYSSVPVIKKAINLADEKTNAIFDSPPGISCPFIATVKNADYVILVTEPTPFGLNDLKLSVETLQQLGKKFGVIINRAGLGNNDVYEWLRDQGIQILMEIPFDREIARIYSEGLLIVAESKDYSDRFIELLNSIENSLKQ
jgi:MinD superfamily P-loop ATPase